MKKKALIETKSKNKKELQERRKLQKFANSLFAVVFVVLFATMVISATIGIGFDDDFIFYMFAGGIFIVGVVNAMVFPIRAQKQSDYNMFDKLDSPISEFEIDAMKLNSLYWKCYDTPNSPYDTITH